MVSWSFLVPFVISAAITGISTYIEYSSAKERQKKLEALAGEKLRLQKQRASFEAEEKQNEINRQRRQQIARRRSIAVGQGQTVEMGLGSSANLADVATASSAKGASLFLGKSLSSTLAMQQSEFDIATADKTPGLAEQIGVGLLGAGAGVTGAIGTQALSGTTLPKWLTGK
jgi:multidrug efflux pump subunit AcrA (membrane-fusion protein)